MKAQMFLVTMIFLVGLIFFVQQTLFGYTSLDPSRPLRNDEYYTVRNINESLAKIMGNGSCQEKEKNLLEFREFIKKESLRAGYELGLDYRFDCPKLEATISITQKDITTTSMFRFP